MEPMKLSFIALLEYLNRAILGMKDPRLPSNGTKYSIGDAVLGAFSVFFMQSESFLEHQRHMDSNQGKSNATKLFGMIKVPTVPQIRNIVDGISANSLSSVFNCVYQALRRDGHLKPFQDLGGLLIALDGTQYFDSHKLNCKCCSSRKHKNGTVTYFHSAILPVIVAPEQSQVISLAPEFITPQDDWLKYLDGIGEVKKLEIKQWNKNSREIYSYQYVNHIPLRDSQPAIEVNWCKLVYIRESDGKILYENAFITHHELNEQSIPLITAAGRCRWKTENENHNVLKTKGYHLEHNFGHGQEHLASCLLTLNLLAFLFHTVLHLTDPAYQQIRHKRGTRKGFFQDILSLTKYLLFESWFSLIDFMLYGSKPNLADNSS
jgi:hypothetical protein